MTLKPPEQKARHNSVSRHNIAVMHYNLENYCCPHCGGGANVKKGRIRVEHRQFCLRVQWMEREFPKLMKMIQEGRR